MRIVSVFVGLPRKQSLPGGIAYTGGAKSAVPSAHLGFDGFQGDGQANLRYHGGRDRAACLYIAEHYAWWREQHGIDLPHGSLSENLTVQGVREEEVCIGDVFRAGDALVQVSLPRDPCRTIDVVSGVEGLWTRVRDSGRCGFHLRTLQEGLVRAGDPFQLVSQHEAGISVSEVLSLYHGRSRDRVLAQRLAELPELAEQAKRDIARRLAGE